jgi:hypothetical protein
MYQSDWLVVSPDGVVEDAAIDRRRFAKSWRVFWVVRFSISPWTYYSLCLSRVNREGSVICRFGDGTTPLNVVGLISYGDTNTAWPGIGVAPA